MFLEYLNSTEISKFHQYQAGFRKG
ncbi:hypothetical protein AYI69_g10464, partial [Smittium culicis]